MTPYTWPTFIPLPLRRFYPLVPLFTHVGWNRYHLHYYTCSIIWLPFLQKYDWSSCYRMSLVSFIFNELKNPYVKTAFLWYSHIYKMFSCVWCMYNVCAIGWGWGFNAHTWYSRTEAWSSHLCNVSSHRFHIEVTNLVLPYI